MEQSNASHFKLSATSCGTCAVHFDSPETRRAHSKSQWHVTNLKRRIADLGPLTAEQHAAAAPEKAAAPFDGPTAESETEESSSAASDAELSDAEPDDDFTPENCLFCNTAAASFDDNVAHMHKAHGMFIPDRERLIVDAETLVRYLHLVVFGYRECLQCGTQRRTHAAVQQHMLGKGHCRFDITAEGSEFRDFYEQEPEDADDAAQERQTKKALGDAVEEGGSIRLPSGKTLSHRSSPAPPRHRAKIGAAADDSAASPDNLLADGSAVDEAQASFQLTAPSANTKALTRADKRDFNFETQLSRLSLNDRNALAHLPPAEQRGVLLKQKKQLDRQEKAARRLQMRLEMKSNQTKMTHFVSDVPGPKLG
ncbi:hypothetical protein EsH8_IX_000190 [Colletotrichum jinshuiense]